MQFWEGVHLAMTQIRTQKLKSFFSVLGVIIGVTFLIVVVSIVEGMDQYIREEVSSQVFGVNTVTIRQTGTFAGNLSPAEWRAIRRRPRITMEDADVIRERLSVPAVVSVRNDRSTSVSGESGITVDNVQIIAASAEIFQVLALDVARGRVFSEMEANAGSAVIVLGADAADALFEGESSLDRRVRVRGRAFRVIGVLESRGSILGQSLDNLAVVPHMSPIRSFILPGRQVEEIIVQTGSPDDLREAQIEIEGILRVERRLRPTEENNFAAETAEDSLSFWDNISRILFLALPGLVAISLVVGGIVIMNIMLVSVMERTREIGVRKALGAKRRDILTQVLIESCTLSGMGALVGVGAGIGFAFLVRALSPLPAVVAVHWVALGIVLGVGVGVLAGVYPAAQAAKLNPVDALRYE